MEYRQLPHGKENEKFSVIGLGLGGIGTTPVDEIEAIIRKAIDNGINFFDMCTAGATYAPVGRAIAGRREQVFLQAHFGAVYDENVEYGWCRGRWPCGQWLRSRLPGWCRCRRSPDPGHRISPFHFRGEAVCIP